MVPEAFRVSKGGKPFILFDDGTGAEDRVLAFATDEGLGWLMSCDIWLADATFASCPKLFQQLWVLHGQVVEKVLHFVFFLMPNAKESTYVRFLKLLKARLDSLPSSSPGLSSGGFGDSHIPHFFVARL